MKIENISRHETDLIQFQPLSTSNIDKFHQNTIASSSSETASTCFSTITQTLAWPFIKIYEFFCSLFCCNEKTDEGSKNELPKDLSHLQPIYDEISPSWKHKDITPILFLELLNGILSFLEVPSENSIQNARELFKNVPDEIRPEIEEYLKKLNKFDILKEEKSDSPKDPIKETVTPCPPPEIDYETVDDSRDKDYYFQKGLEGKEPEDLEQVDRNNLGWRQECAMGLNEGLAIYLGRNSKAFPTHWETVALLKTRYQEGRKDYFYEKAKEGESITLEERKERSADPVLSRASDLGAAYNFGYYHYVLNPNWSKDSELKAAYIQGENEREEDDFQKKS